MRLSGISLERSRAFQGLEISISTSIFREKKRQREGDSLSRVTRQAENSAQDIWCLQCKLLAFRSAGAYLLEPGYIFGLLAELALTDESRELVPTPRRHFKVSSSAACVFTWS